KYEDGERRRIAAAYDLIADNRNASSPGPARGLELIARTSRGYLLEGDFTLAQAQRIMDELLVDSLIETGQLRDLAKKTAAGQNPFTVLLKPGVMDPAAQSVLDAARDLGIPVEAVRTFRRYYVDAATLQPATFALAGYPESPRQQLLGKALANDAIE